MASPASLNDVACPRPLVHLRQSLTRPTDALPLDIFRVLVGIVVFIYFLQTFLNASDFSSPDGLIDHGLSQRIYWFTRIGLFQPGLSLRFFQVTFLFACLFSLALIVGYRVKVFALVLYIIAVSTYRWNFLVMYVDDSVMHLALFWLLLLPVGRTLVLKDWLADREHVWQQWKREMVPGFAVRCLLWNLALIYLVAGLWKWTSPMWRQGTALYAIFKLPISLSPELWGPQHLPVLVLLNYCALVFEPLFPLIFILPRGHRLKYALLVPLLGFHLGTLATLQIPFANLVCMAAFVVPFGGELMERLRRRSAASTLLAPLRLGFSDAVAVLFVTVLTLAMLSSVSLPHWRAPTRGYQRDTLVSANSVAFNIVDSARFAPTVNVSKFHYEGLGSLQWAFFSSLWSIGVAQQYQLFNWIDDRNYYFHYEVIEYQRNGVTREIEPENMFPRSTRSVLLQGYLHGVTWMRIPNERQVELRSSLNLRFSRRYCRQFQPSGEVSVYSTIERIIPAGNRIEGNRVFLMSFRCSDGEARMQAMNLDP